MQRELICVCGLQGFGKSVWTQLYAHACKRLFVSDPLAAFRNVDFMADPAEWWPRIQSRELQTWRFGTHHREELEFFGHAAFNAGDCTFVIEECALMFPRGMDLEEWAKRLIFMGRHTRVNLVLVAQRAVKIPLDVRSQATRIVTFCQTDPNDVAAITEVIGGTREMENQIRSLPRLSCLDWRSGEGIKAYSVTP